MVLAESNFSKTIQLSGEINEVEPVKPAPFSSIVLFEHDDEPLCLGTLITPSEILTSEFCTTLVFSPYVSHC